jgi:pyridoxamine 5'-phosphate oxidase
MIDPAILATFHQLLAEAKACGDPEPYAMTLATVDAQGQPSARTVLLKSAGEDGFVFYTNYGSRKGVQLLAEPRCALLFHWRLMREGVQVNVQGRAAPVSDGEADDYFATRPRGSQAGAWASLQSQTLDARATLEDRLAAVETRYAGVPIPRPAHWSGFRVVPSRIEFWYGERHRLHTRHLHELVDGRWTERMLYP